MEIEKLKYPIGNLTYPNPITDNHLNDWVMDIKKFPKLLRIEVESLQPDELEWKYRPGGWCIREVVHHCADSHINSQSRFKLALTEENPTIKPYLEDRWAKLGDMNSPIEWSLILLEGLHSRWGALLDSLSAEDLMRTYFHPEHKKSFNLKQTIALYSWHGQHHLAHIKQAINAKGSY